MPPLTRHDVACALDLLARLEHVAPDPRDFVQAAVEALAQFIAAEGAQAGSAGTATQFRLLYRRACELAPATAGELAPPSLLTRREVDVMGWLACGKTDAEIGALLAISPRTVNKHLQHVYEKLGVETRTAAVMALQRRAGHLNARIAPEPRASFNGRT